ncbi:hypothetical protein AZI86_10795 [Bdellovibrio bacteriovorus]|uniref:Alpha/beta hydrolase n=1 Tax=Bdellovibrio bacteriovorus TaxID=959 RepID=A0A150WL34_BDEBC|nr:alpha/beta hydrolase [Bdellovibrio bacteriovorus]KYG64690.1 hypothetical protein AZI86_10795 [Bdellovibrio bacteriovorus]
MPKRKSNKNILIVLSSFLFFPLILQAAETVPLKASSKDELFAEEKPHVMCNYPLRTSNCADLCKSMKMPYDEMKHVNGRDIVPKRGLAKPERFDLNGLQQRKISIGLEAPYNVTEIKKASAGAIFSADTEEQVREIYKDVKAPVVSVNEDLAQPDESTKALSTYEVGDVAAKSCKWATIWVHGATPWRGGLGMNDTIFGGAFNRMKHLAQDNEGLYYSPTIQNFGDTKGLAALIRHIRQKSCPNGKIILNCGSAGVSTCWQVANEEKITKELSGMVLIGGGAPYDFQNSNVSKEKIPVLLAQGEKDYPDEVLELAEKVHKADPSYPFRTVVFKNGGHMTPLRMLDWRTTMNCMLSQTEEKTSTSARTTEKQPRLTPAKGAK